MSVVIFWIMCHLSPGHEKKALLISRQGLKIRLSRLGMTITTRQCFRQNILLFERNMQITKFP